MIRLKTKSRLTALFLLATYLMLQAISVLHTHECEQDTVVCQDCKDHVKHKEHFSQTSITDSDCTLCEIIQNLYINTQALNLPATVLLFLSLAPCLTQSIVNHKENLPSLRAPPVIG